MVLMGKSGEGLFLATSNNGVFNTPSPSPPWTTCSWPTPKGPASRCTDPRWGWPTKCPANGLTGGQYMSTQDGGQTWSASFPISPDATEDHFMPMLAFDDDGNPFVAVKFGDDPMVVEGVMRSTDGGQTFQLPSLRAPTWGLVWRANVVQARPFSATGVLQRLPPKRRKPPRHAPGFLEESGTTTSTSINFFWIDQCHRKRAPAEWLPDGRLLHLQELRKTAPLRSTSTFLRRQQPTCHCRGRHHPCHQKRRGKDTRSTSMRLKHTPWSFGRELRWLGNSRRILDQRLPSRGIVPTRANPSVVRLQPQ